MDTVFYEIKTSIGSYYAINKDYLPTIGYAAKFCIIRTLSYNYNDFEAIFCYNGDDVDLEMNGWTFSNRISGSYRIYNQIPSDSPEFTIKALDPLQHQWQLEVHTDGFFKEAAADYMNSIALISKFPNRDIADAYYYIKQHGDDFESSEITSRFSVIRDYYQSTYEEGTDEFFWDQIKTTYNKALEKYKLYIDSLRL